MEHTKRVQCLTLAQVGWVAEHFCAEVAYRRFVLPLPKRLRICFRIDRRGAVDQCWDAACTVTRFAERYQRERIETIHPHCGLCEAQPSRRPPVQGRAVG